MANSQGEYSPAAAGSQYQSPFHQVPHGPSYGYSSPMFCVLGISKFFESFHGLNGVQVLIREFIGHAESCRRGLWCIQIHAPLGEG